MYMQWGHSPHSSPYNSVAECHLDMVEVPGSNPGGDTGKIVSGMALHVAHNVPISPHSLMGKPLSYTQVILVQFQVGVPLSLTITMPLW